jgi:hypothetical protein
MSTINIGSIGNQRTITFRRKLSEELVKPAKYKAIPAQELFHEDMITPLEAFRRWKVARKAWKTRKWKNQLSLPL